MRRTEFSIATRRAALKRAKGICECGCGMPLDQHKGFDFDHIIPCELDGDNSLENCRVVNRTCHRAKTSTEDMPRIKKVRRTDKRQNGLEARKAKIAGSKGTGWRNPIHGPAYRVDE